MSRRKVTDEVKVSDIHAMHVQRAKVNHETYKILFGQCCRLIRDRAGNVHLPQVVHFKVPGVMFDRPPYKHHHATRYIKEKLERNGFKVDEDGPGGAVLRVTWPPAKSGQPSKPTKPAKPSKQPKPPPPPSSLSKRMAALRQRFG